jgi:flagellar biosynthesis protein FlhG
MASLFEDQAAGLRRLFAGAHGATTVAFAGPAARGELVAALASGLAAAGKEVVVVDEHTGGESVAAAFGLRSRFDLLQAVHRDVPAAQVLLRPEPSIRLLPAARAARQHARLDPMEQRALAEWLRRLQKGVDFVLVDAMTRAGAECSPLLPQPRRIVMAVSPDAAAITEAYVQMKRLALARDCRRFGVVILRSGDTEESRTVFANLREAAGRHFGADIELLGGLAAQGEAQRLGAALAEVLLGTAPASGGRALTMPRLAVRSATAAYPVV